MAECSTRIVGYRCYKEGIFSHSRGLGVFSHSRGLGVFSHSRGLGVCRQTTYYTYYTYYLPGNSLYTAKRGGGGVVLTQLVYHSCILKIKNNPHVLHVHNLSFKNNPPVFAVHVQNTRIVFLSLNCNCGKHAGLKQPSCFCSVAHRV